jgi:hypothetical protein
MPFTTITCWNKWELGLLVIDYQPIGQYFLPQKRGITYGPQANTIFTKAD